jgi:F-box domain
MDYRSLADLPSELLHIICQQLGDDDLVALARLSAHLHRIALPMYFERIGFDGSTLKLGGSQGMPFKVLKRLRLSFTLEKLKSVHCVFTYTGTLDDVREIRKFIALVPAVSSLSLSLPVIRPFFDVYSESVIETLFALIDTLHDKSCNRLEIIHLRLPDYQNLTGLTKLRPVETFQEVILQGIYDQREADPITSSPQSLFLDWLILSMNNSPIHTFKFTGQNSYTLSALLDRAVLPHLTKILCIHGYPGWDGTHQGFSHKTSHYNNFLS